MVIVWECDRGHSMALEVPAEFMANLDMFLRAAEPPHCTYRDRTEHRCPEPGCDNVHLKLGEVCKADVTRRVEP